MEKKLTYFTFIEKNKEWEISVLPEFLQNCADPSLYTFEDLCKDHKVHEFFHNDEGPAISCKMPGKEHIQLFVLNKSYLSDRVDEKKAIIEEIKNRAKFEKNFDELIK